MPYYEEGANGVIVRSQEDATSEAISAIERADDETIVQRLTTGSAPDVYLYDYPVNTKDGVKHIIGISSSGADMIAKELGNIETINDVRLDKDSDPDYIYAMVRVKDLVRNVTLIGVGRQCKFVVGRGNEPIRDRMDEHAFVKAVTKGQRNGILHHVPEEIILKAINAYKAQGKERKLAPPRVDTGETSPAVKPPSQQAAKPPAAAMPPQRPVTPTPAATKPAAPPVQQPAKPATPATIVTPPPAPPVEQKPPDTATTAVDASAAAARVIAEQQEKLKNLRVDVNNRFMRDLGMSREQRQKTCVENNLPESLTEMNEDQLKQAFALADKMVNAAIEKMNAQNEAKQKVAQAVPQENPLEPAGTTAEQIAASEQSGGPLTTGSEQNQPVYARLGFESQEEQERLRGRLFAMLTEPEQLGLAFDEAKKFITDRQFANASSIPKTNLSAMIDEVAGIIETKKTPSGF